jgi:hypothetical protein
MKKYIWIPIIITAVVCLTNRTFAQHQVYGKFDLSTCAVHTENSMAIVGDKRIKSFTGFSVGYGYEWGEQTDLDVEFSYLRRTIGQVQTFDFYSPDNPETPTTTQADLRYSYYICDLAVKYKVSDIMTIGIGPSYAIINRSVEVVPFVSGNQTINYRDELSSRALGVNTSIQGKILLDNKEKIGLILEAKPRFLYSIWFDEGGRDLSNYRQISVTVDFCAGISYAL